MQITTIGLDIAKNVFQVHGIDTAEKVVVRKQLRHTSGGARELRQGWSYAADVRTVTLSSDPVEGEHD